MTFPACDRFYNTLQVFSNAIDGLTIFAAKHFSLIILHTEVNETK